MTTSNHLIVNKSNPLIGKIKIPGDKSISHRSIILGSLSEGQLTISNFLNSSDCIATIHAMRQLGVDISIDNNSVFIEGKGLDGLNKPKNVIDAGNSGTLIRLLSGILAAQEFKSVITGDESLKTRPMARIIEPLISYGASIESNGFKAPLKIIGSKSLNPIRYNQDIASAQVKSCLIMSALYIENESTFYEEVPTRDHTENLLQHLEYQISRQEKTFCFNGRQKLIAKDIHIGSDISSAAFFIVAGLILKDSIVEFSNVNINKYRTGILRVLKDMGANIEINNIKNVSNEDVGDIRVIHSKLKPINISGDIIPSLIDELPILFIACTVASGVSKISGIEELRHKESDRIKAMEEGLSAIGIKVSSTKDSIEITGGEVMGGKIDSYGDHRIAMSFAIAGLISKSSLTIMNTKNIDTSFPNFVNLLRASGCSVYEI